MSTWHEVALRQVRRHIHNNFSMEYFLIPLELVNRIPYWKLKLYWFKTANELGVEWSRVSKNTTLIRKSVFRLPFSWFNIHLVNVFVGGRALEAIDSIICWHHSQRLLFLIQVTMSQTYVTCVTGFPKLVSRHRFHSSWQDIFLKLCFQFCDCLKHKLNVVYFTWMFIFITENHYVILVYAQLHLCLQLGWYQVRRRCHKQKATCKPLCICIKWKSK